MGLGVRSVVLRDFFLSFIRSGKIGVIEKQKVPDLEKYLDLELKRVTEILDNATRSKKNRLYPQKINNFDLKKYPHILKVLVDL